nr:MAG TPA: hypothetical protein [Caudoviricetes sp.]
MAGPHYLTSLSHPVYSRRISKREAPRIPPRGPLTEETRTGTKLICSCTERIPHGQRTRLHLAPRHDHPPPSRSHHRHRLQDHPQRRTQRPHLLEPLRRTPHLPRQQTRHHQMGCRPEGGMTLNEYRTRQAT